eukprot:3937891-Rhodomonas_salina.1
MSGQGFRIHVVISVAIEHCMHELTESNICQCKWGYVQCPRGSTGRGAAALWPLQVRAHEVLVCLPVPGV